MVMCENIIELVTLYERIIDDKNNRIMVATFAEGAWVVLLYSRKRER